MEDMFLHDAQKAVEAVHNSDKLLVVIATDDSDASATFSGEVDRLVETHKDAFASNICLRVSKSTQDCVNFETVYAVNAYPSWFVINSDGEVAASGAASANDLVTSLTGVAPVKAAPTARNYSADEWCQRDKEWASSAAAKPSGATEVAYVLIRLLNGEKLHGKFKSSDTLLDVVDYIDQHRTDGSAPFVLMTRFPNHVFSQVEMHRTLRSWNLSPSGTVFLGPASRKDSNTDTFVKEGSAVSMISTFNPVVWLTVIWGYIMSIFLGAPEQQRNNRNPPAEAAAAPPQPNLRGRVSGIGDIQNDQSDDDKNEYFGGDSTMFQGNDK